VAVEALERWVFYVASWRWAAQRLMTVHLRTWLGTACSEQPALDSERHWRRINGQDGN
jgi:hypothetical protein